MKFSGTPVLILMIALFNACTPDQAETTAGKTYLIAAHGDDAAEGTLEKPWKTLAKANTITFKAGDTLYLEGGETFHGTLVLDKNDTGIREHPIVVSSHGPARAIINAGNESAVQLSGPGFVTVLRLHLIGSGRKNGNTRNGLEITNGTGFVIDSVETEGFQKNGVLLQTCSNSVLERIHAHDNGAGGILISGNTAKKDCHHIVLRNSRAENNPGDPTNLTNHSGNGILAGYCSQVTIEYCTAANNGWDMPRTGNGPVGIWTFESDSVVIQHCISYRNKTSNGGEDGGGYDLDGGVTNSTIQYCLSYENQGAGFGIFQYAGASPWHSNTLRYNISANDGLVSAAKAGVYIWNGSQVAKDFTDCYFYNNTIYNDEQSAISYSILNGRQNFVFYNNILIAKDNLIRGLRGSDTFLGNNWRSLSGGFNLESATDFDTWVTQSGQEKYNGNVTGYNLDPGFVVPTFHPITNPHALKTWRQFALPENSLLRSSGLDLKKEFGISIGAVDFLGTPGHEHLIGAVF